MKFVFHVYQTEWHSVKGIGLIRSFRTKAQKMVGNGGRKLPWRIKISLKNTKVRMRLHAALENSYDSGVIYQVSIDMKDSGKIEGKIQILLL